MIGVFGQVKDMEEDDPPPPPHPSLTPRQAEVLGLLEHGRSTDQIARELHLSTETVRNHIRNSCGRSTPIPASKPWRLGGENT